MMNHQLNRLHAPLFGLGLTALLTTLAAPAHAGCENDTECKGDRICSEGVCTSPPPASCSTDVDCSGDKICMDGGCAAAAPAPSPDPEPAPAAVATPVAAPPPPPAPMMGAMPGSDTGETKGITGLIIAGPIVLGATWLTTIGVTAAVADGNGKAIGYAATPVFGPWMLIAEGAGDYTAPLAMSGLAQAGGLTMLIVGLAVRRPVNPTMALGDDVELTVSPTASSELSGLMATGTF